MRDVTDQKMDQAACLTQSSPVPDQERKLKNLDFKTNTVHNKELTANLHAAIQVRVNLHNRLIMKVSAAILVINPIKPTEIKQNNFKNH